MASTSRTLRATISCVFSLRSASEAAGTTTVRDGLSPTSPQHAAGIRIEPPVSVPRERPAAVELPAWSAGNGAQSALDSSEERVEKLAGQLADAAMRMVAAERERDEFGPVAPGEPGQDHGCGLRQPVAR